MIVTISYGKFKKGYLECKLLQAGNIKIGAFESHKKSLEPHVTLYVGINGPSTPKIAKTY